MQADPLESQGSADQPLDGDVVITSIGDRHYLSVIPHAHRLSFSKYEDALEIAMNWAEKMRVRAWRVTDGDTTSLTTHKPS